MAPQSEQEYIKLLTEIIQKEMLIFGPLPVLLKAKAVKGLKVSDNGAVSGFDDNPHEITKLLIVNLFGLSEFAVRKSVEPILGRYAGVSFAELGIAETTDNPVDAPDQPSKLQEQSSSAPHETITAPAQHG